MLIILLTAIFLLPVFSGWGKISEKIFGEIQTISGKLISGIFSISLLWAVVSFFSGLNVFIEFLTVLIGIFSFFYFKIYQQFRKFLAENRKLFLPFSLVIGFAGSFFPFILDHFGYYIPTIKWISQFGLTKGISNLDLLLGQMSFWHIFQAGFSHFSDSFLRMNSIILIVYLLYIFEKKSWLHLIFLPVLFLFSQSPSPDLPVVIFSLIILNEILSGNRNFSFLFAVSALVFAIKPTMIWLPIFVFLHGIFISKTNLKFLILGIFVLIIFFIKNLWCFGFPVFPVQFGDVGISWKPNPELLKISSEIAIEKTFDSQFPYSEIQHFSTFDYIKNWIFLKGIKSKINILFLILLLVFLIFTLIKKNKTITILCISIFVKSILVLAFSAQYRFFIDVFFVIVFVMFYQKISRNQMTICFSVFSIFFLSFLSFPEFVKNIFPSFKLGSFLSGFYKEQLFKPLEYKWEKHKTYQIGNLKFNVVKDYPFSFDVPIPAISPEFLQEDLDAGIFPQQNSEHIKNGFHWRKMNDEEKQKLKNILKELHWEE